MNTKIKTINNKSFTDWLDTVPSGKIDEIREKIISNCGITPQVFRHWKSGNSRIPFLAQLEINKIAEFEVFKTTKAE